MTICERGKPIALLVPFEPDDELEALYASGMLSPLTLQFADIPSPVPLPPGARRPGEILEEMRSAESW